jgi:two-component system response regulator GlrR
MVTASVPKGPPPTVLVVEEKPDVSRLVRRILSDAKILATSGVARALQVVARTPVDLVILDVKIRDVSGTEALRHLRNIDAGVPVIVVTSHGTAVSVRAAMELGAFDYLTKPFGNDEIEYVVRAALASRTAVPVRLRA